MAFSQSDLDALDACIASGQLRVRFADRQVDYQTTADLLKARELIAARLADGPGQSRRSVYHFTPAPRRDG